jgi:ATP-binding cassette subfamily F protein 3
MSEQARKKQHESQKQSSRDREKRARRWKELEDLIAAGEKQLSEMREKLREDPAGDWAKLAKMAAEEQALAKRVDSLMTEWTKLGEELSG